MRRGLAWAATAALVVLGARALAYALAPQQLLALELEHEAGGPRLVVLAVCALGLGLAAATAIVGLAWLAVRERVALAPRLVVAPPRLRPVRFVARYAVLLATTCTAFALLESYLHWRAGLGWHGIHCLVGPVHRDAIPLLAALSLVAVALLAAVEHLLAWMRRTLARLAPAPHSSPRRPLLAPLARGERPRPAWLAGVLPARGPPALAS